MPAPLDDGGEPPRLRGAGTRLRATLAHARAALEAARLAARRGQDAAPAGADADRVQRARLFLVAERLDEAERGLAQATGLAATLAEALERERATVRVQHLLLREADHRIRGSLQGLASLLRLRAGHCRAPEAAQALRLCTARVEAVGKVHDMLRGAGPNGAARLDLDAYLRGVCLSLGEVLGMDGTRGEIVVEVEPMAVAASAAQAIGLAVGELVANAARHAFAPGVPGTVWVQGTADADGGGYRLSVSDDGRGLPDGFVPGSGGGFGLRLVALLADQAGAGFEVRGGRGARFVLILPMPAADRRAPGRAAARHPRPDGPGGDAATSGGT